MGRLANRFRVARIPRPASCSPTSRPWSERRVATPDVMLAQQPLDRGLADTELFGDLPAGRSGTVVVDQGHEVLRRKAVLYEASGDWRLSRLDAWFVGLVVLLDPAEHVEQGFQQLSAV